MFQTNKITKNIFIHNIIWRIRLVHQEIVDVKYFE